MDGGPCIAAISQKPKEIILYVCSDVRVIASVAQARNNGGLEEFRFAGRLTEPLQVLPPGGSYWLGFEG